MPGSAMVELVLLEGGKALDDASAGSRPRGDLRLISGGSSDDAQAAIEETVAAAQRIRLEIEERITLALDELLCLRAPVQGPG